MTGSNQAPLAGAAVTLTGSRRGVVTDPRGAFTISVPDGEARLTVSQIGYTSRQVVVPAGQSAVNVALEQESSTWRGRW